MEIECKFCGYKFETKSKANVIYCPRCSSLVYVEKKRFGPFTLLERLPRPVEYLLVLILLAALAYLVLNMLGFI